MSLYLVLFSLFCIILPLGMIVFIMKVDIPITNKITCPNESNHTKTPEGYIERSVWAQKMLKTHKQIQCKLCGLWAIWTTK